MAMMGWRSVLIAVIVAAIVGVLLLLGIWPRHRPRDVFRPWLTCIDCPNGQLDSVTARYHQSPSAVGDSLLRHVLRGPVGSDSAWAWRTLQRALLRDSVRYASGPPEHQVDSVQARAREYFRAYRNTWRARALVALAAVKDPRACIAADSLSTPADTVVSMLRKVVQMARDSLAGC
jgi:hypothetical protein